MANATFESSTNLGPCPGCGRPLAAQSVSEVVLDDKDRPPALGASVVNATVKVVGIRINHDCIPKVTR